jgi:hypothetical protein
MNDLLLWQIGSCFAPQNRAIAFWQNASDATVKQYSDAILALEEAGDLDRLRDTFVKPVSSLCETDLNSGTKPVTFMQVKHACFFRLFAFLSAYPWIEWASPIPACSRLSRSLSTPIQSFASYGTRTIGKGEPALK